ncbi:MAG: diguanylate cyclase [Eubacterium sp.]|jgi:diguanylate cyclase (GGDEF)-like protein|nr:diguanylate cyclase [Eubacterium sp.]
MNFDSLNQTVASIRILQKFYSIIRIWDANHKQILYQCDDNADPVETSVSIADFRDAALSINENENTLEISIPVNIDGQSCSLELIQHSEKNGSTSSLRHMQKLIITDSLTNLYNRRYIDEQLPVNLEKAFHNSEPVSFIYADIDLFKKINDQYGHIAGDYVLNEIADIFQRHIRRKSGWVARYGGDEFLTCLPEINTNTAIKIANRIRRAVEDKSFYINDHFLKITCSFGVQTVYNSSGVHTVNQVVGLLDKKLYLAKKKGRNKVVA